MKLFKNSSMNAW